jgi:5'-nucleotidase (lipoprotein e(P4) family)
MHTDDWDKDLDEARRRLLRLLLVAGASVPAAALGGSAPARDREPADAGADAAADRCNPLLWAAAWKQTAAEFHALCYQAFNLARLRLDQALVEPDPEGRPLAVITDVDDTLVHASDYWGHLIKVGLDFFDDPIWDQWIARYRMTAVPGALEFCRYCADRGVEVFYVTNRDQGERTFEHAATQLERLGFPFVDDRHLIVFRDSSDKSPARAAIAATHRVALLIGDNLNDYKRDYYLADVDARLARMAEDREDFGRDFILLPNPTDGHWVRAIFGDSEPPATDANRRILKAAATRTAWDGR